MPADSEWVSWAQAAEMVGCPVPTIDWYSRQGRIQRRAHTGSRPTLRRDSVEEFAVWWKARLSARETRRKATATRRGSPAPPTSSGWLLGREAAVVLGVSRSHVYYLAHQGRIKAKPKDGRWWFEESACLAHRVEEARWVSFATAAEIVGCGEETIGRHVKAGFFWRRNVVRARPSLNRASVEAFAERWRAEAAASEQRRRERARKRAQPARPPDIADDVWLNAATTALVLRISRTRVDQLSAQDRLPFTVVGRRRWYRRSHIEQIAAARALVVVSSSWSGARHPHEDG